MNDEDLTKLFDSNNSDNDSCDMRSCHDLHATVSIDSGIEESTNNTPLNSHIVMPSPEQKEVEVTLPALPRIDSALYLQSAITARTPAFGSASKKTASRVHQICNYS